jgi:hypothetical protein
MFFTMVKEYICSERRRISGFLSEELNLLKLSLWNRWDAANKMSGAVLPSDYHLDTFLAEGK